MLKKFLPINPSKYWTRHLVHNEDWKSKTESLDHFHWRNHQYPGYIELMPVNQANGIVVMDYGCGPGNDLIGFSEYSKPSKLIGVDVSSSAIQKSKERLLLHKCPANLLLLEEVTNEIPLESNSVDLVHSSGVLHHALNINLAIEEIHRVMKSGAKFQVMVYNYYSLWVHLYTAYCLMIESNKYSELSLMNAFQKTTDGPNCPIAKCYVPDEFVKLVSGFGFTGKFKGASVSIKELELLPKRLSALKNRKLGAEQRDFLSKLTFNEFGHPLYEGNVAGINACYEFFKN